MAGYSGKPVAQKLGIKPGFCLFMVGLSCAYGDVVGELPDDVRVKSQLKAPLDMVHLFATEEGSQQNCEATAPRSYQTE
jgi:hypothetical protein